MYHRIAGKGGVRVREEDPYITFLLVLMKNLVGLMKDLANRFDSSSTIQKLKEIYLS